MPKTNVGVISHHRGSVVAEVKFTAMLPVAGLGSARNGRMLATEFCDMFKPGGDRTAIREGELGRQISGVELHGPISEETVAAFRACLSERDRDSFWVTEELRKSGEKLRAVEESNWAAIDSLERQIQFLKLQQEEDTRVAVQSKMGETAEAMLVMREEMVKASDDHVSAALLKQQAEINQINVTHSERMKQAEGMIDERERELDALRHQMNQLEVALSLTRKGADFAKDAERIASREREKYLGAMRQVNDLLVPEIRSCASTLNNIESEMGFFHAYHMRALSIANVSGTGGSGNTQEDASKSKEMMQRDIETLRSQLEALAACSFSDPFVLGEQLANTISHADRSKMNVSFATPQSRGGMVSVKASPPTVVQPILSISSQDKATARSLSMPEWGPRIPPSSEGGNRSQMPSMMCCMVKVEVVGAADLPSIDILAPQGSVTFAVLLSVVQGGLDASQADHSWPGGKAVRVDDSEPQLVLEAQHRTRDKGLSNGPITWDESFVFTHSQYAAVS